MIPHEKQRGLITRMSEWVGGGLGWEEKAACKGSKSSPLSGPLIKSDESEPWWNNVERSLSAGPPSAQQSACTVVQPPPAVLG